MLYKLMVKTHNITGLKYLCITKKDDYLSYKGSGVYWKRHLKKYGRDISTELIYESDNYEDFIIVCIYTSIKLEVVSSEEFANLVNETGYINTDGFKNFWKYISDSLKKDIIERRTKSIKNNHWTKKESSNDVKLILSEKALCRWNDKDIDERRIIVEKMHTGLRDFFKNKDSLEYINYVDKLSKNMKKYCAENFNKVSERNRKARLNTSPEVKQIRKEKIQAVYKSGKHDALYKRFKLERIGSGNPNAKSIEVDGVIYGSVQEASRVTGIPSYKLYKKRREDEKNKID